MTTYYNNTTRVQFYSGSSIDNNVYGVIEGIDSAGIELDKEHDAMKEWDKAAGAWVDFVRTGKDFTRLELNNPAMFDLIGNVDELFVLDLACGEGFNTRILAGMRAKVFGVDFSEKLINFAEQQEAEEKLGIQYEVADVSDLSGIKNDYFHLVTCFMAMQDIRDYHQAVAEVGRVLKTEGRFVFSIPHPCFEKITVDEQRIPAWNNYFEPVEYHINWNMERLEKLFKTTSFHRTLTDYFQSLHLNKLSVQRLVEPKVNRESLEKYPILQDGLIRPQSVIIEAIK